MTRKKYDLAQRVQALTLLDVGMSMEDVGRITGFSRSTLYDLKKRATERGYDPVVAPIIYDEYAVNAKRNGKPGISLDKQQEIVAKVTMDRYGREKSTAEIARKVEVSQSSPQQRKPNKRCGSSDSR